MSRTYSDFLSMLSDHLVTDTSDADFMAILPRIIEAAEMRIYRDLDLPNARRTAPFTLSSGSATLARPADMVTLRDAWITSGTTRTELQRRDQTFLRNYWPDTSQTGTPKYYATYDDGSILIAPTPASSVTMTLFYTYRPTPLSASNSSTWLTTNFPDLFDFAALVYAAGWQKNFGAAGTADDAASGSNWTSLYASALAMAKNEISMDKAFGPFDHTAAPPMPVNSPPGGG